MTAHRTPHTAPLYLTYTPLFRRTVILFRIRKAGWACLLVFGKPMGRHLTSG